MSQDKRNPTPFIREATGLVKSVSALDVLAFTLLAAGPLVLIPLGVLTIPTVYQGSSLVVIFGLSLPILLALAFNTVALSSTMPRAGGDYVFGSRVVHPIWGMIPSFMALFSFVVGIGTLAVLMLQAFLGPAFLTSYPQTATTVIQLIYVSKLDLLTISALLLLFVFGLAMLSNRAWFWFIRILSLIAFVGVIVLSFYLFSTPQATLEHNFNVQLATGFNTTQVYANATASGWQPNVSGSPLTTAGAMVFVFFFLAAPISAYFAGEIKNTFRSMSTGVIGGTLVSWVIAAIGVTAFLVGFGYRFLSAYGFEALVNPSTAPSGAFSVNALVLAAVVNPNTAFFIGLGFFLALLGLVAAPILPASRILFAWSFDQLIPKKFASVSDRTHTPLFSLSIICALTIIVAALDTYLSSVLRSFLATTLIVAIAFLPNGVTALLLPYKAKHIFQTAPLAVKKNIGRLPFITITGLIHTVGFGAIILLVFLNPASAGTSTGTLSTGALGVVIIGLAVSVAFYPLARMIRRRSGVDLSLAFKEIPPN
ncbi:MAG: amino acid permease [Thermoprotei archaeon]